jgi:hypothetical protein
MEVGGREPGTPPRPVRRASASPRTSAPAKPSARAIVRPFGSDRIVTRQARSSIWTGIDPEAAMAGRLDGPAAARYRHSRQPPS